MFSFKLVTIFVLVIETNFSALRKTVREFRNQSFRSLSSLLLDWFERQKSGKINLTGSLLKLTYFIIYRCEYSVCSK